MADVGPSTLSVGRTLPRVLGAYRLSAGCWVAEAEVAALQTCAPLVVLSKQRGGGSGIVVCRIVDPQGCHTGVVAVNSAARKVADDRESVVVGRGDTQKRQMVCAAMERIQVQVQAQSAAGSREAREQEADPQASTISTWSCQCCRSV